jgi:hypothetical protein
MEYLTILLAHYIGDWLFQTRYIAENKSKKLSVLFKHVSIYGLTLLCLVGWSMPLETFCVWLAINVTAHAIQDWFLWRIAATVVAKKLPKSYDMIDVYKSKAFWDTVGTDQFIHYMILFSTYISLTKPF